MSELDLTAIANEAYDGATTETAQDTSFSESDSYFNDADIQSALGVESDVTEAADPPASSSAEVENEETEDVKTSPESDSQTQPETETVAEQPKTLNWDDDKVPFREEYKQLKKEFLELKENSLDHAFLTDVSGFKSKIQELSTSQYAALMTELATESAEGNPAGWVDYFIQTNPDLLAQKLTGDPTMTAERLNAEREILKDDDLAEWVDDKGSKEKQSDPNAHKYSEMERKLQEIEQREKAQATQALFGEIFQKIAEPADALINEAELTIKADDTPEDKEWKEEVNFSINNRVSYLIETDPKISHIAAKAREFIEKGDKAGASNLIRPIQAYVEAETARLIKVYTNRRAHLHSAITETKQPPKTLTAKTAASGLPPAPEGYPDGDWLSDADLAPYV